MSKAAELQAQLDALAKEEAAKTAGEVVSYEWATPPANNNRMDWSPEDFPASIVEEIDVKLTKKDKPYIKLTFADKPMVAALIEQLLYDTKDQFIISQPGSPIQIDRSVPLGVLNGKFFTSK